MASSKGSVKQNVCVPQQANTLASSLHDNPSNPGPCLSHHFVKLCPTTVPSDSASDSGLRMQKQAFLKTGNLSQMWQYTPLTTALWRQRPAVLCEVVSSLGYIVSSRVKPCLRKTRGKFSGRDRVSSLLPSSPSWEFCCEL